MTTVVVGVLGIIATLITGFTAFHNTTNDFRWPFMVVGILLSVLILVPQIPCIAKISIPKSFTK